MSATSPLSARVDGRSLPMQATREAGSLLVRWFDELRTDEPFTVLDLAGGMPETIALLSDYRCRVYCADLLDNLCVPPPGTDMAVAAAVFEDRLSFIGDGVIDYCLLWDYPNYLSFDQLRLFSRILQGYLHLGSQIHMFTAMHANQDMAPWRYSVADPETLVRRPVRRAMPGHPHSQAEIVDAMEYVRLDRGALRDGRVETLLECI